MLGVFEKGVGVDFVMLIGYVVYDLIYYKKNYIWCLMINCLVFLFNFLLVDLYKKKRKEMELKLKLNVLIGSMMLLRFFNICL